MTRRFAAQPVLELGVALFAAAGAGGDPARAAVDSLVTSSLMGHDSHGVIRIPEYLELVSNGSIVPDAAVLVERTGPATAVVDCGRGFGAVGAARAVRTGIELARVQCAACVATRRCHHVGRLGTWVELAAREGLIALATCNSPRYGHYVVPWGGREGRLATNPIAYAVPTGGDPIVADFSTSVAPEGKIRVYRNTRQPLPVGWILDSDGRPATDPDAFYGPQPGGILPLGGAAGHKGFALGLLVELLGSGLAGVSFRDPQAFGNGVCFVVLDPSAFCPLDEFRRLMDETVAYVKSSAPAPGFEEVLVPGELEFRTLRQRRQEGIPIDPQTLAALRQHGARLGVEVERFLTQAGDA